MNLLQRNMTAWVTPQYGKGNIIVVLPSTTDPSQNIRLKYEPCSLKATQIFISWVFFDKKVKKAPKFCTFGCFLKKKMVSFPAAWPKYSELEGNTTISFLFFFFFFPLAWWNVLATCSKVSPVVIDQRHGYSACMVHTISWCHIGYWLHCRRIISNKSSNSLDESSWQWRQHTFIEKAHHIYDF